MEELKRQLADLTTRVESERSIVLGLSSDLKQLGGDVRRLTETMQQRMASDAALTGAILGTPGSAGLAEQVRRNSSEINDISKRIDSVATRGWAAALLALGAFFTAAWKWIFEHKP